MKLATTALFCLVVGSPISISLGSPDRLRGSLLSDNDHPYPNMRKLQDGPPPIASEIFVLAISIPTLDPFLAQYETPIALRFTNYFGAMWWNCVAAYSSEYKDTLTKASPAVRVPDSSLHTSANRVACMAQTIATYTSLSLPEAQPDFLDTIMGNNPFGINIPVEAELDMFVAGCQSDSECLSALASDSEYSPTIMGQIVAKLVYEYSINDGYNQLGNDDGCVVSCRPYKDITGYAPVNDPTTRQWPRFEQRWEPLLEDNGRGFFFRQEHVTPQIGTTAKFRFLPESERITRVAAEPGYTKRRIIESRQVLNLMSQLDDVKKVEVEVFDDKLIVANAIFNSFIGKAISSGYSDPDFSTPPGLFLSVERFVHFLSGYLATEYDATVIAWKEKVNYDLVRPTSVIKKFRREITTWAPGGIQTFPASNFEAHKRVMPHSEYVSGSACLFQAAEDYIIGYLEEIGLTTDFPVLFDQVDAGASKVEPGLVPAQNVTLQYPTIEAMAAAGSQSRLNGGMHFEASVPAAKDLCSGIGYFTVAGMFDLYRTENLG